MYFDDWASHPNEGISANLLWEYDISSPLWDWKKMDVIVVSRVIERGWPKDYYAMFHLYGGIENVKDIIKRIPHMNKKDISWCCSLFHLREDELWNCKRESLRRRYLKS